MLVRRGEIFHHPRPDGVCQVAAAVLLQALQHGELRAAAQHVRLPQGNERGGGRPARGAGRGRVRPPLLRARPGPPARADQAQSVSQHARRWPARPFRRRKGEILFPRLKLTQYKSNIFQKNIQVFDFLIIQIFLSNMSS